MLNLKQAFCNHQKHDHDELIHGPFEDEPGGPATMHYISWRCRGCGRVLGDPLDRNDRPPQLQPPQGYMWRRINDVWRMVCDTCGGNCGQCGITGRIGNVQLDMDHLIKATGMDKTVHGLRR